MRLLTILLAAAAGFSNPVIPGMHPDPSVCRVGQDYYLVNSSFQFFPGVPLHRSRDLVHWEQIGSVLDRESQLPLDGAACWGGIYAPTIRHDGERFYMITTNVSSKGNFLVHTTDPSKGWSEPVWLEQGGIDPSLYFEDGVCYMVSNPDGCIYLCTIDPLTGKTLSPSKPLWKGTGGRYPESPHIYRRGGWYYLMISEGGTEMGHSVTIARSRRIDGPYKANPHNPILTHFCQRMQGSTIQGCGHADMVQAADGSWWAVFLAFRIQNGTHHCLGRETFLAPVQWTADGWPGIGVDGTVSLQMDCPTLPQVPVQEIPEDLLKSSRKMLLMLNNPVQENYVYKEDGLYLRPTLSNLDTIGTSSFVGAPQNTHGGSVETVLDRPEGCEAGLSVYGAHNCHAELYVREDGTAGVKTSIFGLKHTFAEVRAEGVQVSLKIEISPFGYNFYADGKHIGFLESRFFSSETIGGFTGVVIGMYAYGDGAKAHFRNFLWK